MDTVAFILGTAGTVLWATGRAPGWEGVLWLLSSVFWIVHAYTTSQAPLMARDILGLMLYAAAIYRVFILPRIKSRHPAQASPEVE